MSHFTRVKTQITDREMLVKALDDLKYKVTERATVRGYMGNTIKSDLVAKGPGSYDVGFDKDADGNYQAIADWWGLDNESQITTKSFMEPLTQRYAYHKVVAEVAKQGFQVVTETTAKDATLKVTVRRWS